MYEYTVSKNADHKAFSDCCALLLSKVENIKAGQLLNDFDRARIQHFNTPDGNIKVFNDYEVDAVYIEADIDLSKIFN